MAARQPLLLVVEDVHWIDPSTLELLGLVVDLNRVHLTITADPAGGVLGSLFCGLAHTQV